MSNIDNLVNSLPEPSLDPEKCLSSAALLAIAKGGEMPRHAETCQHCSFVLSNLIASEENQEERLHDFLLAAGLEARETLDKAVAHQGFWKRISYGLQMPQVRAAAVATVGVMLILGLFLFPRFHTSGVATYPDKLAANQDQLRVKPLMSDITVADESLKKNDIPAFATLAKKINSQLSQIKPENLSPEDRADLAEALDHLRTSAKVSFVGRPLLSASVPHTHDADTVAALNQAVADETTEISSDEGGTEHKNVDVLKIEANHFVIKTSFDPKEGTAAYTAFQNVASTNNVSLEFQAPSGYVEIHPLPMMQNAAMSNKPH